MNDTKVCSKCHHERNVNDFYKDKYRSDGLKCNCKFCDKQHKIDKKDKISLWHKQNYLKHKDKIDLRNNQWISTHKEQRKLKLKQWELKHKYERRIKKKQQYLKNKEKNSLKRKKHRMEHRDEILFREKQYRFKHKKEIRIAQSKYEKIKRKIDPSFRMLKILRCRMNMALKDQRVKKTLHIVECLVCTSEFFKNYIKSLFKHGMTLANDGIRKWHLHHIKPCYTFDLVDPEQQKLCFHYTNTIPMWEDEHYSVHANNHLTV
jgi:hypothetical protein